MSDKILSLKQARLAAKSLCYLIIPGTENSSRCIDGRYQEKWKSLPPLAKPGADAGDLLTILAAIRSLKLKVSRKAILEIIAKTVGKAENFSFHTDEHEPNSCLGCGHLKQAQLDPKAYGLASKDIDFVFKKALPYFEKSGAARKILKGTHKEKAVLIVNSSCCSLKTMNSSKRVFIYHKTLDDKRKKLLAENLFKSLSSGPDKKTILRAIAKASEKQLKETLKRLAQDLPVFEVKIDSKTNIRLVKAG